MRLPQTAYEASCKCAAVRYDAHIPPSLRASDHINTLHSPGCIADWPITTDDIDLQQKLNNGIPSFLRLLR